VAGNELVQALSVRGGADHDRLHQQIYRGVEEYMVHVTNEVCRLCCSSGMAPNVVHSGGCFWTQVVSDHQWGRGGVLFR
jgi:hypothetical protein